MRVNEYNSLEDFTYEYDGKACGEGHYCGLEFSYKGSIYRLHTGAMFEKEEPILEDGRKGVFCLYKILRNYPGANDEDYVFLGWYADMSDLLKSKVIDNREFREVIMDDSAEMLAKD